MKGNWGAIYLFLAILFEVAGTSSMKLSQGLSKAGPSVLIFIFYFFSLSCLTMALKTIPVTVAYTIWSGLGSILIGLISYRYFGESFSLLKVTAVTLIVLGVVLLNASHATE